MEKGLHWVRIASKIYFVSLIKYETNKKTRFVLAPLLVLVNSFIHSLVSLHLFTFVGLRLFHFLLLGWRGVPLLAVLLLCALSDISVRGGGRVRRLRSRRGGRVELG